MRFSANSFLYIAFLISNKIELDKRWVLGETTMDNVASMAVVNRTKIYAPTTPAKLIYKPARAVWFQF